MSTSQSIQIKESMFQIRDLNDIKQLDNIDLKNMDLKNADNRMQQTNTQSSQNIIKKEQSKNIQIRQQNIEKTRQTIKIKLSLNQQILFNNKYQIYQLIQSKQHYDIYRGYSKQQKQKVIIKLIDKQSIKNSIKGNQHISNWQQQYYQFIHKIYIQHQTIDHLINNLTSIFLIDILEIYQNDQSIVQVCQNYYHYTLQAMIKKRKSLPICQALAIIKQILYTLSQLHKQNIILTQLNPSSIIYKNGVFSINDLSSMKKVNYNFKSQLNLYQSYSYYDIIAPQLNVCPQMINIKSQIWALGILFYHMIAHHIPYQQRANHIIKQAKSHQYKFQIRTGQPAQQTILFIKQLLETDPDQRLSWKKLVNHEIFEKQQYFKSLKMIPIVDVRAVTLKKKENDVISEQIINSQFNMMNLLKKINPFTNKNNLLLSKTTKQLPNKNVYVILDESNKFIIQKHLDIQEQTYSLIQKINLMSLKGNYLYQQILLNIEQNSLIDKKRRSHVQILYLISLNCFNYFRKAKTLSSKSNDRRVQNYLQQLKTTIQNINSFHLRYKRLFQFIDSSTYYISNDLFTSIINKNKLKQKEKFFKGKQQLNFNKSQLIQYTQDKYIQKFITQIKTYAESKEINNKTDNSIKTQNTHKGDYSVIQYVKLNLKNYQKINKITLQDLKSQYSFNDVVTKIINNKNK